MPQRICVISVPVLVVADHRRGIVREDAGHGREVAEIAVDDAEWRDDRGLVSGDAVEIAHGRS